MEYSQSAGNIKSNVHATTNHYKTIGEKIKEVNIKYILIAQTTHNVQEFKLWNPCNLSRKLFGSGKPQTWVLDLFHSFFLLCFCIPFQEGEWLMERYPCTWKDILSKLYLKACGLKHKVMGIGKQI